MDELGGRVAVVTGAASGIGLATATRFAQEGMRVVLADIEGDSLEAAVSLLQGQGHEAGGPALQRVGGREHADMAAERR
jgi:NAD(P)-dependent dehydrogenase (short-subunit alcohol dehydrogenase family)